MDSSPPTLSDLWGIRATILDCRDLIPLTLLSLTVVYELLYLNGMLQRFQDRIVLRVFSGLFALAVMLLKVRQRT